VGCDGVLEPVIQSSPQAIVNGGVGAAKRVGAGQNVSNRPKLAVCSFHEDEILEVVAYFQNSRWKLNDLTSFLQIMPRFDWSRQPPVRVSLGPVDPRLASLPPATFPKVQATLSLTTFRNLSPQSSIRQHITNTSRLEEISCLNLFSRLIHRLQCLPTTLSDTT
jgi:hypothetical protein